MARLRAAEAACAARRRVAAAALLALIGLVAPAPARAQGAWDDARVTALVQAAIARRAASDTLLKDYRARAHGYLSFLAQLGDTLTEPPRLVKSSELMVDVLWRAPALSKQVVVGLRDTALYPGDIGYYSDRYGIVQSNFPDRIRLGDGRDVADVPHPVSPGAPMLYSYRVRDSLTLTLPGRRVDVWEVDVRPRDEDGPRVVGSLFLERSTGDIVRMALTFTRAAILDPRIEVLAVTLENALEEQAFWLPRRQELEVRRAGTWFDFPARGIIRARWEVGEYLINRGLAPSVLAGPPIVFANPDEVFKFPFTGRILDGLPAGTQAVTPADVERVQQVATSVIARGAIAKADPAAIGATRVSDLVRVSRVEGFALGLGTRVRPSASTVLGGAVRTGFAEGDVRGTTWLQWVPARGVLLEVAGARELRDAFDDPERSGVVNSIAAQEFGADATQPYAVREGSLALQLGTSDAIQWRAELTAGRVEGATVHAAPSTGRYAPTLVVPAMDGTRLALGASERRVEPVLGGQLAWSARLVGGRWTAAQGPGDWWTLRGRATLDYARLMDGWRLVTRTTATASAGSGALLPTQLAYAGGPVSAPGYDIAQFAARGLATLHVEGQWGIPFLPVPLGRFGRVPGTATLAPFVHVAAVGRPVAPGVAEGLYPSVGLGGLFFFDLVRVDVARGMRDGRWSFSLDLARAFWGIL
jgi:hypothetical protein